MSTAQCITYVVDKSESSIKNQQARQHLLSVLLVLDVQIIITNALVDVYSKRNLFKFSMFF